MALAFENLKGAAADTTLSGHGDTEGLLAQERLSKVAVGAEKRKVGR